MTRDELLNKLYRTPVTVKLTALVSEGALECQYMTSKGTKEEWIGIDEWPVSIIKESEGVRYLLVIEGESHSFDDYQSFSSYFEKHWIGEDVRPWEECSTEELEQWLELIGECEGIPGIE